MTTPTSEDWTRSPARPIAALILLAVIAAALAALAPAAPSAQQSPAAITRPIDLNNDPADVLQLLPNIGPRLAQAIVNDRTAHGPFDSLDDLQRVSGIGPRTVLALDKLAVAAAPTPRSE